jgi:hypothetical protein
MFLEWDKNINKYVSTTKKLKELLATIKTLRAKKHNADAIYQDLYNLLLDKYASKSELNCFINACDSTTSTIKSAGFDSFKYVVDLYLKHRDFTEITPKEWIQAIIDKGASRAKGSTGENKLVEIVSEYGFVHVNNWKDFKRNKKSVAVFSKNHFDLPAIKRELGIELKFNSQNKMLDIILKNGDKVIFIEAKHLKEGGGSQDKQIKELIGIIQRTTGGKNVFYGAFLDGIYSNVLLENVENPVGNTKIAFQRKDMGVALKNNKNSFWFNTAGFVEFAKDFYNS